MPPKGRRRSEPLSAVPELAVDGDPTQWPLAQRQAHIVAICERIGAGELSHDDALSDPLYRRSWERSESYRNPDWSADLAEERVGRNRRRPQR